MKRAIDIIKALGLEPIIELCRIEFKNGALFIYIPRAVREKLNIQNEHNLIAVCDGNSLFLVKDGQLEEILKPDILRAREMYAKLKQERLKNAES